MKNHQGFVSTAHNYLSNSFNNSNQNYKCQTCHLQFQSPMQLQNHTNKFCTNSGFDTLAGLNVRLKNPNYGMARKQSKRKINDSLTNALEEIQRNKAFVPAEKELRNDMLAYQRHEQDIKYTRPYMHGLRNNNIDSSQARRSRSLYQNAANTEQKNNQGHNLPKYKPQQSRSNAYSLTSSHMRKFKQSNAYISPPSILPSKQNAKQFSLLQRSDMSIKRMPYQQKRQYVVRKLLELEQIEEGYKKNGGKNDQFMQNTKKMRKFYENLMEDVNNQRDSKFGNIRESRCNNNRVSTPISRLEQFSGQGNLLQSLVRLQDGKQSIVKSRISQIHQKNIARRQDQVRKRFRTQAQENPQKKNQPNYDILDEQMFRKINSIPKENQIIVIPIQQPSPPSYHPPSNQQNNQMAFRYLQSLTALKDEQNKTFLSMMQKQNQQMKKMYEKQMKSKEKIVKQNSDHVKTLEKKYQKMMDKMERQQHRGRNQNLGQNHQGINQPPQNNFRISSKKRAKTEYSSFQDEQNKEYRQNHNDLQNVRLLNLQSYGYYTLQNQQLTQEEKILMQMQKQQRDQLQLFAHLPFELQQIKLPSLKQLGDKRFEMEKQVIKQKLEKLHLSEEMKHFELQRKLLTEQLENQKKKITIHKLMKKKIQGMVKQEFQQRQQDETDHDQDEDYQRQGQQFGGEPFGGLNNISNRNSHNVTPISQV